MATATTGDVLIEVKNKVGYVTFNRPEKLNALSAELIAGATAFMRETFADPDIGAIVFTGEGRAFCAGGDVSTFSGDRVPTLEETIDVLRRSQELVALIYRHPRPTIAAVNGFAVGAGLGIALSCDLRIASDKAKLGTAYANVGFGGDWGTTWGLTRLAGPAKAKELFFLPEAIKAEEAKAIGLVNRVVPHDELMEHVTELAERIAHGPLVSYRYMKENVNLAVDCDFREMLDREAMTHMRCGQTEDFKEGVAAFMEKRKPQFKGR